MLRNVVSVCLVPCAVVACFAPRRAGCGGTTTNIISDRAERRCAPLPALVPRLGVPWFDPNEILRERSDDGTSAMNDSPTTFSIISVYLVLPMKRRYVVPREHAEGEEGINQGVESARTNRRRTKRRRRAGRRRNKPRRRERANEGIESARKDEEERNEGTSRARGRRRRKKRRRRARRQECDRARAPFRRDE